MAAVRLEAFQLLRAARLPETQTRRPEPEISNPCNSRPKLEIILLSELSGRRKPVPIVDCDECPDKSF